jgi:hypothetical protein
MMHTTGAEIMFRKSLILFAFFALLVCFTTRLGAQAPTGAISGAVLDPTGAKVSNAKVHVVSSETGFTRTLSSGASGDFSTSALPAGRYAVDAEAKGFKKLIEQVEVAAGDTIRVDLTLQLGSSSETVTVSATAEQLDYESNAVSGTVTREEIQALPLNGRNFLQLAGLQPGVSVSPGSLSIYNNQFSVSVMGGDSDQLRITVDGISNQDQVQGGTEQTFSQEVVQEFQMSTSNMDLNTGLSGSGSINIVSRTGGNDFHGGGYFFYRDHNMAAYPGLKRNPFDLNPFFARRQSGGTFSGPIIKNKLFFFANVEHTNQMSVVDVEPSSPALQHFGIISQNPYNGTQPSFRFDYQANQNNTMFLRYSHDSNSGFGPRRGSSLPSNFVANKNWADESMIGWTSTLNSNMINDLHLAYTFWSNRNNDASAANCATCLGLGGPQIDVSGANFSIGNEQDSPQGQTARHYIVQDNFSWQKGKHRFRTGVEFDHVALAGYYDFNDPGQINVWSPEEVAGYNVANPGHAIALPATFSTLNDILSLPLMDFTIGVGSPLQPPPFDASEANSSTRLHFYGEDTWKLTHSLTISYGLAWNYESNLLDYDLSKPAFLSAIFGANNLAAPKHYFKNFSPAFGFSYAPFKSQNTVFRGGVGIYYDSMSLWKKLTERAYLGPIGNGRYPIPGSLLGVQFNSNPTPFTVGMFEPQIPTITTQIAQELASFGSPTSLTERGINLFKSGDSLYPSNYRTPESQHFDLGMQQKLGRDWMIDASFVFRHSIRTDMGDFDWNFYNSAAGPTIPNCTGAQALDVQAVCSEGEIDVRTPYGKGRYMALLVKADKSMTKNLGLTIGYTLQSQVGFNGIINYYNWWQSVGPQANHHVFNLSGIYRMPWGFQASLINSISSKGPVSASISGIDLNGSGVGSSILPGSTVGAFNMSMGKSDLARLVNQFNTTLAGGKTSRGQAIPTLTLPSQYSFGQVYYDQDVRFGKQFAYRERFKLDVFGEGFNVLGISNYQGYSGDLRTTSTFMQPTSRIYQVFGSGGPRAFQLGSRLSF